MVRLSYSQPEIAELIDATQWSDGTTWPEMMTMSLYLAPSLAQRGTVIFTEGSVDRTMGILVKGSIDIMKSDGHGKAATKIATLHPPQAFGEMSLFDSEPRSATAIAANDALVLFISKDNFEKMTNDHPALACKVIMKIAKMISRRLRKTSGQLVEYLS